ncbi:MAG: sterol desaturase family protein [Verrucomicrobiota bacterium]|nr:sterol desaturase family protein [Verrucomicrobiota bacterium]
MSVENATKTEADELQGSRNAKGEWRPPYAIKYAPIFRWPPQIKGVFKWLFGYPGYLWPWNVIYVAIVLVSWFYLQPSLDRCVTFKWDWIAQMLLRNLALVWIISGGWHLLLYTWKVQGNQRKYDPRWQSENNPSFLFKNQVYDNIFWSCVSAVPIWTAYEVFYMWAAANHWVPYVSWTEHPIYCTVWMLLIPIWREFHFYWIHRLIHWKRIYRYVHSLHHKNVNPGPWSGLAMHPIEHIFYFSVVLIHWVVPSHPIHFLFNAQHTALTPAGGHHGFEGPILDGKIPTGSYFHYLHHRYFECNYGEATLPLDKLFGTFRDGLPTGAGAKLPEEHKS